MSSPADEIKALFFGCWGEAGHFLRTPSKTTPREEWVREAGFPPDHWLDGSRLFLPYPENVGEGRITYLAGSGIYVMSWWGSPWDNRGAVNNHFMYKTTQSGISPFNMWHSFNHFFPDLAKHHQKPIIGTTY